MNSLKNNFLPLINKIKTDLQRWDTLYLSLAGRELTQELIKTFWKDSDFNEVYLYLILWDITSVGHVTLKK